MRFVIRDPKKGSSGSSFHPTMDSDTETQYEPCSKCFFFYMLCLSPAQRPPAHPRKRAMWLFRVRGTLPETAR